MLLQAEIATEVVKNSFETSPDTVFGVLVSILVLFVIILAGVVWRLVSTHRKEMKEIFERHEVADQKKYEALTEISNKTLENLGSMTAKIDELIRAKG